MASVLYYSGPAPQVIDYQEGATSGSFAKGDLVKTDSSGQVVLADAGNILGVALKGFTGTQGSVIPVAVLNFDAWYVMAYSTATAQALVGSTLDITFSYGAQVVGTGTTTKEVEIIALHPGDAVTTSGGRLIIRFNRTTILAR